ncbi:MAG: hypothetical protein WC730_03580 [Patescibacteria group bacterium]|jgi:hypothetical protein
MFKKEEAPQALVSPLTTELKQAEQEFKREVTITESVPFIRKAAWILFIVVDVLLCTFVFGYMILFLVYGSGKDASLVARIENNTSIQHDLLTSSTANELLVDTAKILSSGADLYDFSVEVENPNMDWYATFSYAFSTSKGSSESFEGFILPQETRPLIAFSQYFEIRPTDVEITFTDFEWHRVDHLDIPDVSSWLTEHGDFKITDISYGGEAGPGTEILPTSSFKVTNNSPYSYWDVEYLLVLKQGSAVVGVNTVTLPGFESNESREVTVRWFDGAPSSGTISIYPQINYFDDDIYMSLPTGDAQDILERL